MFLDMTIQRNPGLLKAAVKLHRERVVLPNTYLIDVDAVRANVRSLVAAARKYKIKLYMMTKQIGRNPDLARIIAEEGITRAVAVDPWEALTLGRAGIKLGNVGHLVQIPSGMIREILELEPEVITIFSQKKAEEISEEVSKMGKTQDILLKVVSPEDLFYDGQLGGIKESRLLETAAQIKKLPGIRIVGLTSFPCFLYDPEAGVIRKTKNADTIVRSAKLLQSKLDLRLEQINTPSVTTVVSFPLLHELGATHGEPGHSLTGTTPVHGEKVLPEIPSMVYISEISHLYADRAYTYGGGFYKRSQVKKALVGQDFETMRKNILAAEDIMPEAIDYYGKLIIKDHHRVEVGDTVVYAFRTQIFVTRSEVALVEGVKSENPTVIGIYDSLGRRLR